MERVHLTLALSALGLFAGCSGSADGKGDPAQTDADADADTDTDTDADLDTDTGTNVSEDCSKAVITWAGEFQGDGTTLSSGAFGLNALPYNIRTGEFDLYADPVCAGRTNMEQVAPFTATCPECVFTYSVIGVDGASSIGNVCSSIEYDIGSLSGRDVGESFAFGWSPYYTNSDGTQDAMDTIWLYLSSYPEYGFFIFAAENPPYYRASGDGAGSFDFGRVIFDGRFPYLAYY